MAEDKLARTGENDLSPGEGREVNQLVMVGGEVLEGQHKYMVGEKTYVAKPLVCYLDKNDFVTIESGFGNNVTKSYVLKVDAKKKIMALAGVDSNESHFTTSLGNGNRDVCEYESIGKWMSPTGQVTREPRRRRIDLKEVERQQTMHKMKNVIRSWEDGSWEGPVGNKRKVPPSPEQKQKLEAFTTAFAEKVSHGMETDEAMYSLRAKVLPMSDILQIQANVADMREHLAAITQSKCQSQLGTAMMRNFGGRCLLTEAPGDRLKVYLVNTVEIPALSEHLDAVNVLWGDETVVTADGEEKSVEDIESDAHVQEIREAEAEPVIEGQFIETSDGKTVDTSSGEVREEEPELPQAEPEAQPEPEPETQPVESPEPEVPSGAPTRAELQQEVMRIGAILGKVRFEKLLKERGDLKALSDSQLADFIVVMEEEAGH